MLTVMLPDTVEEPEIRKMMQDAEETCEKLHMEILGGHTEITNVVKQPLISVTGVGKMKKENLRTVSPDPSGSGYHRDQMDRSGSNNDSRKRKRR